MRITITIFCICLLTSLHGQHTFPFDTYNTDDNRIEEIFDTFNLEPGVVYDLRVQGTYSTWVSAFWTDPCGHIETAPMFPSPLAPRNGNVGVDMEYFYSMPEPSRCRSNILPLPTSRVEITLDNGVTWFHPSTTTPYNSDHLYTYEITGEGFPLGVRHTSDFNSDDYGVLKFELGKSELTSVDDFLGNRSLYNIYPNPTSDILNFQFENAFPRTIEIYNVSGRLVNRLDSNKELVELDVRSWISGMYIARIQDENTGTVSSHRILIQ